MCHTYVIVGITYCDAVASAKTVWFNVSLRKRRFRVRIDRAPAPARLKSGCQKAPLDYRWGSEIAVIGRKVR